MCCGGLIGDTGGLDIGKGMTSMGLVCMGRCGVLFDCEGCWKRRALGVIVLVSPCDALVDMRVE